jgi:lipopolysaccharide biosynthesis glycosyltransferase
MADRHAEKNLGGMERSPIHIAITLNKMYLIPACVMLVSLFENNPLNSFHIHIITDFNSGRSSLLHYTIKKYKNTFTHYTLSDEFLKTIRHLKLTEHAQLANYYRLFLSVLLDESIQKVLYLDADLIICSDISPVYNLDLTKKALGAVSSDNKKLRAKLNIPDPYEYFNSGVLLINLHYFREQHLVDKFLMYIGQHTDKITYWDQDVLNALLFDQRVSIGKEWNVDELTYTTSSLPSVNIIHYTGSHKPWHYNYNTHPLKKEYFKYLRKNKLILTANCLFTLETKIRNKFKR